MCQTPMVSVLLPVHNGMPFLPETVESLLRQSLHEFELIALDDGSTDEGTHYLRSLQDERLRYVRLERAGLVAALNEGLRLAQAEAIARIDADDLAAPTRLEEQYRYLQTYSDCVLLGSAYEEIDIKGNPIPGTRPVLTTDTALRFLLCFQAGLCHPSVMFRRTPVRELGGYRSEFDVSEDYDLFSRLAGRGRLASLPNRLLRKRIHPGAVSVVHWQRGIEQSSRIARTYISGMFPELDSLPIKDLFLLNAGQPQSTSTPAELWQAFRHLERNFESRYGPHHGEVRRTIHEIRRSLGWQCLNCATSTLSELGTSFAWLVAAHRFDPEEVSIPSAIRRGVRKVARRLVATPPKPEPEMAGR